MNGLPVRVPQLIRAKVLVYFIITSWISLIFIILMAWRLDEWTSLPTSIVVMFANSIYIVALTAFLMGLRPNKAIFGRVGYDMVLGGNGITTVGPFLVVIYPG